MTLPSPLCLWRAFWSTLHAMAPVSGHVRTDEEVHENCTVYVTRCNDCGDVLVLWEKR